MRKTAAIWLLAALCLLAGCVSPAAGPSGEPAREGEPARTEKTEPASAPPEEAPAASSGEPEGWEEEWPEEYPIERYRLAEGAIRETGRLQKYRYLPLDGAEKYPEIAAAYVKEALDCGDRLTLREDSPHDGYANWLMEAPNGSAAISGSSITGRFSFSLYPGFERILAMKEKENADRSAAEKAARAFAERFLTITGGLTLARTEEDTLYYRDERGGESPDVEVPAVLFTFRSETKSEISLALQEGLTARIECGDSSVEDLTVQVFTVTVWPDGTVVRADNYITSAEIVPDGTVRAFEEGDLPELVSHLTSGTEGDAAVIEEIRAARFSVYFGSAEIEPLLIVTYYFESDPSLRMTTEFVMGLFGE